jgi:hypothetical protein
MFVPILNGSLLPTASKVAFTTKSVLLTYGQEYRITKQMCVYNILTAIYVKSEYIIMK